MSGKKQQQQQKNKNKTNLHVHYTLGTFRCRHCKIAGRFTCYNNCWPDARLVTDL